MALLGGATAGADSHPPIARRRPSGADRSQKREHKRFTRWRVNLFLRGDFFDTIVTTAWCYSPLGQAARESGGCSIYPVNVLNRKKYPHPKNGAPPDNAYRRSMGHIICSIRNKQVVSAGTARGSHRSPGGSRRPVAFRTGAARRARPDHVQQVKAHHGAGPRALALDQINRQGIDGDRDAARRFPWVDHPEWHWRTAPA